MQLNKSYLDICKSTLIPAVGSFEFSSMCKVLNDQVRKKHFVRLSLRNTNIPTWKRRNQLVTDTLFYLQGLLKLSGQSRDIKSKRVTLNVDEGDITFALQVRTQISASEMGLHFIYVAFLILYVCLLTFTYSCLNRESGFFGIVFSKLSSAQSSMIPILTSSLYKR